MDSAQDIEDKMNDFTNATIGEKVYLDLSCENNVILKPLCSRGSISLGAFWVKLLQHPNNYPVYSYPYKKQYHTARKYELVLRIDGIAIIVDLVSGKMIMKGQHVIDWFIKSFPLIMSGYSSPVKSAAERVNRNYNEEEYLALKCEKEKMYKKYIEKWPLQALDPAVNVMDAGKPDNTYYESISTDKYLDGYDLETHSQIADLLDETDTNDLLERLLTGKVIQGSVLYRLWKSTLNLWFSDKDAKIIIVTPYIDTDRLSDVCELFLQHKLTACIDSICIPMNSLYGSFADVRKNAIKRFPSKDQVTIEYKIFNAIIYPFIDFTTSFIAIVKDGNASLLQMNTNFNRSNFVTSKCATVEFSKLTEVAFYKNYMDPLVS